MPLWSHNYTRSRTLGMIQPPAVSRTFVYTIPRGHICVFSRYVRPEQRKKVKKKKRKNIWLKAWNPSSTFATIPIVPALPRTGKKNRVDSPEKKKRDWMQTDSEQTPNSGCASLHCQDLVHSRLSSNSNLDNEFHQEALEAYFGIFFSPFYRKSLIKRFTCWIFWFIFKVRSVILINDSCHFLEYKNQITFIKITFTIKSYSCDLTCII